MEEKTNVGFGFSFSKKKESKVLKNDLTAVVKGETDDRDFLNAVEGKELKRLAICVVVVSDTFKLLKC